MKNLPSQKEESYLPLLVSFSWPPNIHSLKFMHPFFPTKHIYFKYPSAIVHVCILSPIMEEDYSTADRPMRYHNRKESTEWKLVKIFGTHAEEMPFGKMAELNKLLKESSG